MEDIAIIDIESTGLDVNKHEVIEVACIVAKQSLENPADIQVVDSWEAKLIPENIHLADPVALEISGYSDEKWKDAISKKEGLEKFSQLISKIENNPKNPKQRMNSMILVGQNLHYDVAMLQNEFHKNKINHLMSKYVRDTNMMAKVVYPNESPQENSLRKLALKFGIEDLAAHTAMGDVKVTLEVYKALIKKAVSVV